MDNVTLIAAIGKNNELGYQNKLLWHLKEDLQFFKKQTEGKYIVMGKNTFDSLPSMLPNRIHIVLTHQNLEEKDNLIVFNNFNELKEFIKELKQEVMIIGGAQIYKLFINEANKMILTEVEDTALADAYFPLFNKNEWDKEFLYEYKEKNLNYKHLVYTRKK